MDDADRASEREEQLKAQALAHREPEGPKATGYCLACGEAFVLAHFVTDGKIGGVDIRAHVQTVYDHSRRWCDAQCRDDWERRSG